MKNISGMIRVLNRILILVNCRLVYDHAGHGLTDTAWRVELVIGRGAGYIGGASAWVGHNLYGRTSDADQYVAMYVPRRWSAGWTRNGNHVPYVRH